MPNPKQIQERLTDEQELAVSLEERITELENREQVSPEPVKMPGNTYMSMSRRRRSRQWMMHWIRQNEQPANIA